MSGGDWVDQAVREVWLEKPGIGINALHQELIIKCEKSQEGNGVQSNAKEDLLSLGVAPHPSMISKARIKHSKAWIPYLHKPSEFLLKDSVLELVQTKLQERIALRATRQYELADNLQRALEAMGIEIDDHLKTWTVVKPPLNHCLLNRSINGEFADITEQSAGTSKTICNFCQKVFPSRNHVFKHLRDPTSGCGTAIFASGQQIEEPPSAVQKQLRREKIEQRRAGKSRGSMASHVSAQNSLWVGDIPYAWTNPRRQFSHLRALLFRYVPRDVPTPWIKRVIRKAYRKEALGVYYGYAIVVFRDEDEAKHVLELLNNQKVDPDYVLHGRPISDIELVPFVLKVQTSENETSLNAAGNGRNGVKSSVAGQDPPLIDQLRPLDLEEMRRRIAAFDINTSNFEAASESQQEKEVKDSNSTAVDPAEHLVSRLCHLYTAHEGSRPMVRRKGRPIPYETRQKLLGILESLRWPSRNERQGLAAERYLVLPSNVSTDRFYGDLRKACSELMEWADPDYRYSGIAVTKNFVASPHIDHRDQSFQYAVALGSFEKGGELCVEGEDSTGQVIVNVVTTHNSIARVEGRQVHYVRTWEGGDRYSLIFYNTSHRHYRPILSMGVDISYLKQDDAE